MTVLSGPGTVSTLDSAEAEPTSLPVSKAAAITACHWLMDNFGTKLREATLNKLYQVEHLCAIVCQETAYKWLKWLDAQEVATIVARCVFDASGDYPGTQRIAFPVNTPAFREQYGDDFNNMLIAEANLTRNLQGWRAGGTRPGFTRVTAFSSTTCSTLRAPRRFLREKQWYSFDTCLQRACAELDEKLKQKRNDLWKAIAAYNGSGKAAAEYAANVKELAGYCAGVTRE
jgi:hypothetical protein